MLMNKRNKVIIVSLLILLLISSIAFFIFINKDEKIILNDYINNSENYIIDLSARLKEVDY